MERTLRIPSLGESGATEHATVTAILAAVGDKVSPGDNVLEIETDKVLMEVPAECSGVVQAFLVKVGDQVCAGREFAKVVVEDALVSDDDKKQGARPASANPGVRRLARELGVDISTVEGTGPRGRITKDDVTRHAQINDREVPRETRRSQPEPAESRDVRREALTNIASVTARNMSDCWSRVPHAWLQRSIDITELERWRQKRKAQGEGSGVKLTVTVFLVKAVAQALAAFPRFNSRFDEQSDELVYRESLDIGIAMDTPYGLLVPVLRRVDGKGLNEIAKELGILREKGDTRKLTSGDLEGAGFTISNLGGMGVSALFPIVNWPQVSILGVGSREVRPQYRDGKLVPQYQFVVTLGIDHRVINGADGARFLAFLKERLEDPMSMLL